MSNLKFLIIGRTATGKSELASLLEEKGMITEVSYTTRPPRTPDETTHHFIAESEINNYPEEEKCLRTNHNGYDYFFLKEQLNNFDFLVIDPKGFLNLVSDFPQYLYVIIHMNAEDATRNTMFLNRDKNASHHDFVAKNDSEKDMFDIFETWVVDMKTKRTSDIEEYAKTKDKVGIIYEIDNEFDLIDLNLNASANEISNMLKLFLFVDENLDTLVETKQVITDDLKHFAIYLADGNKKMVSREHFIMSVIQSDEGLYHFIQSLLPQKERLKVI